VARRHPAGIPPIRCTATSRRTGERCRLWAVPGTNVCATPGHGLTAKLSGRPQERVTLAQLEDAEVRGYALPRTRAERLSLALTVATYWTLDNHLRAAAQGDEHDRDDETAALDGARLVGRLERYAADIGVDEALVRNQELESRLLVLVFDAVAHGLTASLPPDHRDRLYVWMLETARDRMLALDPQTRDEADAITVEPMTPPFRLMLAPPIEGEVVHDSADPAPEDAAIARARTRLAPNPADLAAFTDDELADEIERRLAERDRREALGG
jgi:hypothetical protein